MVKSSTLLYFYNDFVSENELIKPEELIFPGDYLKDELDYIFGDFEVEPSERVVKSILEQV